MAADDHSDDHRESPKLGPQNGEYTEQWVSDRFPGLQRVDEPHCDFLDGDTPVEVKGCQKHISEGEGTRRGRYRLWTQQHETLARQGGEYLFVLYARNRDDSLRNIAWCRTDAEGVTEHVLNREQDYSYRDSKGNTALVTWTTIFPRVADE